MNLGIQLLIVSVNNIKCSQMSQTVCCAPYRQRGEGQADASKTIEGERQENECRQACWMEKMMFNGNKVTRMYILRTLFINQRNVIFCIF